MLKIYNVTYYVSIDGADWREVDSGYKAADEEPANKLILDNASFDEAREYLSNHRIYSVWNDSTLFTNKPLIYIRYEDAWDQVSYRHFKTISYKIEYKEWSNVSLDWIIKHLSADQCIQYLKDRGMAACPILK
jgi:hypothetical protein